MEWISLAQVFVTDCFPLGLACKVCKEGSVCQRLCCGRGKENALLQSCKL